jgi:UV DNA damage endonuclease
MNEYSVNEIFTKITFENNIETKLKDKALLQLIEDLSKIPGIKRTGGATIVWK